MVLKLDLNFIELPKQMSELKSYMVVSISDVLVLEVQQYLKLLTRNLPAFKNSCLDYSKAHKI